MKFIDSTYEILAWKHFNFDVDEKWIDWALEMIDNGYDTEYLIELAGISKPYNQFELSRLTTKVFNELRLDFSDRETVIKSYVHYIIDQVLINKLETLKALEKLKDLCIKLDYEKSLYPFYLLFFAKYDLIESQVQWYWESADRNNIDKIILDKFINYKKENSN